MISIGFGNYYFSHPNKPEENIVDNPVPGTAVKK
jgi:hypothetical protein